MNWMARGNSEVQGHEHEPLESFVPISYNSYNSKCSQVSGSSFKVGKKKRIDDPGSCQRMLVLTNSLQWPTVFGVGMAGTAGVEGGRI